MKPPALQRPHGFALLWHTFTPTTISLTASIVLAITLIVVHLVALSVSGTAYPVHFSDDFLMGYTNFIIQPLLVFVNQSIINSALTLIIWAVIGSLVAAVIGAGANALNDWHNTRNDVNVTRYGVVIRHPLQHSLVMRFVWRFAIGVIIAGYTIFALWAAHYCTTNDLRILNASSASEVSYRLGLGIFIWVAIFHCYILLLRLYVQRTRIFGEILY